MHTDFQIGIEKISKTEGHAKLEVEVSGGKVKDVKLKVAENKRFFTQATRKKEYLAVPQFVSRICGTCSIAHVLASTEALEKGLRVRVSEQAMVMKKLLAFGLMIRDHAMHLYFFTLPDIFEKDSLLELSDEQPNLIKDAFDVKDAGNFVCKIIGGRAVHPTEVRIGGFSRVPSEEEIEEAVSKLKNVRKKALELIDILAKCKLSFEKERNYVALCSPSFNFIEGEIRTFEGTVIPEENFADFVDRVVIPYSQATSFQFEGKEYMVGALARLNLNKVALHPKTIKSVGNILERFPSHNIYDNNLAQAIEILHSIDSCISIFENFSFKQEDLPKISVKATEGIGVVEAPRGTLYHMVYLNEEGKVKYANFIIPTAQNQIQMEKDIKDLVQKLLDEGKDKHEMQHAIERLIRAYDPCFSCASHFLKIKWIKI
ncbi:MAG: Ni/Fe hydrogenase subunit alpha [Candidatus Aenigmatarchaeota archaeon]